MSVVLSPLLQIHETPHAESSALLGGGVRIMKSVGRKDQSIVVSRDNSKTNTGQMKVSFTDDFVDDFGMQVFDVSVVPNSSLGKFNLHMSVLDQLCTRDITTALKYKIVNIPVNDYHVNQQPIDLNNYDHLDLLFDFPTLVSVSTLSNIDVTSLLLQGASSDFNTEHPVKQSKGYKQLAHKFNRAAMLETETLVYSVPSTGLQGNLYGPMDYHSLLLIDEADNNGECKDETRVVYINRNVHLDGIFELSVKRSDDPYSNVVNNTHFLDFSWKSSSSDIHSSDITQLQLRNKDNEIVLDASAHLANVVQTGIHFDVNVPLTNLANFEGVLYGYVQYNDISASPFNVINTNIIFDVSTQFTTETFQIYVEEQTVLQSNFL